MTAQAILENKNPSTSKRYYAIGQAAQRLGVAIDTLRRWEREGKITAIRSAGGMRLFPITEIDRLLAHTTDQTDALSVSQAATFLGVSPATLRRWDRENKLKPKRSVSNERIYTKVQLDSFVKDVVGRPTNTIATQVTDANDQELSPVAYIKEKAHKISDALVITVIDKSIFLRYRSKVIGVAALSTIVGSLFFGQHGPNTPVQFTTVDQKEFTAVATELARQANDRGLGFVLFEKGSTLNNAAVLSKSDRQAIFLSTNETSFTPADTEVYGHAPSTATPAFISSTDSVEHQLPVTLPRPEVYIGSSNNVLLTTEGITPLSQTSLQSSSARMPAKAARLFVKEPSISQASKVFLSPQSTSDALYVLEKMPGRGFIVATEKPPTKEVTFDWLIVN